MPQPKTATPGTQGSTNEHGGPPLAHPPGTIINVPPWAAGQPPSGPPPDPVDAALARALDLAAQAGEWATVAELARHLEARRRDRLRAELPPNVVPLDERRKRDDEG